MLTQHDHIKRIDCSGGKGLVSAAFKGGRTSYGWFQGGKDWFRLVSGWKGLVSAGFEWEGLVSGGFGLFRFLVTTCRSGRSKVAHYILNYQTLLEKGFKVQQSEALKVHETK